MHANIQKDGTFSVVPRIRGGVTSPDELRRIADVADKYQVPLVKITGSQRIDLLGIKKEDLPKVWADLGMASGQAYTKGVRMVKTCVGTEFCRFGTQDSTAAGIEMERRFEQLFTPHKVKMATVGCPRNCAEATVKDIGLVGQEGSWQVVVGGAAGRALMGRRWYAVSVSAAAVVGIAIGVAFHARLAGSAAASTPEWAPTITLMSSRSSTSRSSSPWASASSRSRFAAINACARRNARSVISCCSSSTIRRVLSDTE